MERMLSVKPIFALPSMCHKFPMWMLWVLFYATGVGLAVLFIPAINWLGDSLFVGCNSQWLIGCAVVFQAIRWGGVVLAFLFMFFLGLAILDSKKKRKSPFSE